VLLFNHLLQADRWVNLNTLLLAMGIVLVAVGCLLAHRGTLPYSSFCIGPRPSNPPIPTRSIRVDDGGARGDRTAIPGYVEIEDLIELTVVNDDDRIDDDVVSQVAQ
jgi:hypothetical protein